MQLTASMHAQSQVVSGMARAGKVVAAVCHGPMGLVDAKDEAGVPIVKGREVRRPALLVVFVRGCAAGAWARSVQS